MRLRLVFDPALDVSKGGVLLALPALLACGLLRHSGKYFRLPAGFYGLKTIFLLLAFMALARLKSIEALRYYAPGEWGKLLGLDRAPEVRTLRVKVTRRPVRVPPPARRCAAHGRPAVRPPQAATLPHCRAPR